ncbi:hypothetical protein FRC03_002017 [Tulasnella sp. 419]|nr:hypothetical protein FRC02_002276 [Tulasnella sp. 418]KAG8969578.1 hypothetical protein FRC03_002017 [Tulasnella sp. 419]
MSQKSSSFGVGALVAQARQLLDRQKVSFQIPVEIHILIIEQVPLKYLPSLARTSKLFRRIVEFYLYRHIDLTKQPVRTTLLFRTLVARDDLAKLILTFRAASSAFFPRSSRWRFWERSKQAQLPPKRVNQKRYDELAASVLRKMTNVQVIHLDGPWIFGCAVYEYNGIRDAVSRMPLKRLHLSEAYMSRYTAPFLRDHPNLTYLELPRFFAFHPDHFPPNQVPNLETFIGPDEAAAAIVPGRPVRAIKVMYTSLNSLWPADSFEGTMPLLAMSSATVRELEVQHYSLRNPVELLNSIAAHLSELESLAFNVFFPKEPHGLADAFASQLEEIMSSFQCLHTLDFKHSIIRTKKESPFITTIKFGAYRICQKILTDWGKKCPTLRKVILPYGLEWRKSHSGTWYPLKYCEGRPDSIILVHWQGVTFQKDLTRKWGDLDEIISPVKPLTEFPILPFSGRFPSDSIDN